MDKKSAAYFRERLTPLIGTCRREWLSSAGWADVTVVRVSESVAWT
jgi:hypothetical protein